MGPHYLDRLFSPHAIAVFGASDRINSVGGRVLGNLLAAGFDGPVIPINPKHDMVSGQPCFHSISKTNVPVDLTVIATPAARVPQIIHDCGEHGVRAAIIYSAGFAAFHAVTPGTQPGNARALHSD